jgi:transcriptional regulator with XRE-family HTH domain
MTAKDLRTTVGRNIAKARKRLNLTQAELAQQLKCSNNFVALLETGTRAPSFETLAKLSKVLKVKAQKFFE